MNSNICNNDYLFFKVFRNKVIVKCIYSFLKNDVVVNRDYHTSNSLKQMKKNNKYEMILDKLRTKSTLIFDSSSIMKLIDDKTKPYYVQIVKEIVPLLVERYPELIKSIPVLEGSIVDGNFKLFELFFEKLIAHDVSNADYGNIDSGYYRVFSLLDLALIKYRNDKQIVNLLLNFIKYDKKEMLSYSNSLTTEEHIIHRINNDLPIGYFSVPPLFDLLKSNEFNNKSIDLIESDLGAGVSSVINIKSELSYEPIVIGGDLPSENDVEMVHYYLRTPNRFDSVYLKYYYLNNSHHAIIFLLKKLNQIRDHSKYQSIANIFKTIESNKNMTLESLVDLVKCNLMELNIGDDQVSNQLYSYLDYYYIFYCLKNDKMDILNRHVKINYNNSLVFSFSIFKLNPHVLDLCFKDGNEYIEFNENDIYNKLVETEDNKDKLNIYINSLIKYQHQLCDKHWYKFFKILIVFHKDYIIQSALEYLLIKNKYIEMISNSFQDIVCFYFKYENINSLKAKLQIFAKSIYHIPLSKKENQYLNIYNNILKNTNIIKESDYCLYVQILQSYITNERIQYFIKALFKHSINLDFELTLNIFNSMDDSNFKFITSYPHDKFYHSKSNILINHLLKTIVYKDSNKIVKILKAINKNSSINVNELIQVISSSNCFQIIRYCQLCSYFNFTSKILVGSLFEIMNVLDRDMVFALIPDSIVSFKLKMKYQLYTFNNSIHSGVERKDLNYYLHNGEYNNAFELILKYKKIPPPFNNKDYITLNIPQESILKSLVDNSISLDWFIKLYDPIVAKILVDIKTIKKYVYKRMDLFEYIWEKRLANTRDKILFIQNLIKDISCYYQFIEYVLFKKKDIIKSLQCLSIDEINLLYENVLVYGNPFLLQVVRSMYCNLKIDFKIIHQLIKYNTKTNSCRYDMIEYLYHYNMIPNLSQIIGESNLNKLIVKELYGDDDPVLKSNDYIVVSKSMFILIHLIIKSQKMKQIQTNDNIKTVHVKCSCTNIDGFEMINRYKGEESTSNNSTVKFNYANWLYNILFSNKGNNKNKNNNNNNSNVNNNKK